MKELPNDLLNEGLGVEAPPDYQKLAELSPEMLALFIRLHRWVPPGDLSTQQMRALQCLRIAGRSLTMSELASMLGVNNSSASELVKRLVSVEYLERVRETGDERVVRVSLNKKSRAVLRQAEARLAQTFKGICDCLEPETRKKFVESHLVILTTLQTAFKKESFPQG